MKSKWIVCQATAFYGKYGYLWSGKSGRFCQWRQLQRLWDFIKQWKTLFLDMKITKIYNQTVTHLIAELKSISFSSSVDCNFYHLKLTVAMLVIFFHIYMYLLLCVLCNTLKRFVSTIRWLQPFRYYIAYKIFKWTYLWAVYSYILINLSSILAWPNPKISPCVYSLVMWKRH